MAIVVYLEGREVVFKSDEFRVKEFNDYIDVVLGPDKLLVARFYKANIAGWARHEDLLSRPGGI